MKMNGPTTTESSRAGIAGTSVDVVNNLMSQGSNFPNNIWIGDSGASFHE